MRRHRRSLGLLLGLVILSCAWPASGPARAGISKASRISPAGAAGAKKRRWPTIAEIRSAIIDPSRVIGAKLRGAVLGFEQDGQPALSEGGLAVVGRFKWPQSERRAPRVLRVLFDQGKNVEPMDIDNYLTRQRIISGHLRWLKKNGELPPELVLFDVDESALRVARPGGDEDVPGISMPTIPGRSLGVWVEDHVKAADIDRAHYQKTMRLLARTFRKAMADLGRLEIAHGDLHEDNIRITDRGVLKLIDYDDMFVKPFHMKKVRGTKRVKGLLNGLKPTDWLLNGPLETYGLGSDHYQHPDISRKRTLRRFNPGMDNFSSIAIYLQILALAADPTLWADFHSKGTLIFHGASAEGDEAWTPDFVDPTNSELFQRLRTSPSATVRHLARNFAYYCTIDADEVPSLETALAEQPPDDFWPDFDQTRDHSRTGP